MLKIFPFLCFYLFLQFFTIFLAFGFGYTNSYCFILILGYSFNE